jgi:hypothetical protein
MILEKPQNTVISSKYGKKSLKKDRLTDAFGRQISHNME